MGQSNYIAAAIFIAFFVYITAKGSLAKYIAILTGGTFATDSSAGSTITAPVAGSSTSSTTSSASTASGPSATSDGTPSVTNPLTLLQTLPKALGGAVGGDASELLDVGEKMLGNLF